MSLCVRSTNQTPYPTIVRYSLLAEVFLSLVLLVLALALVTEMFLLLTLALSLVLLLVKELAFALSGILRLVADIDLLTDNPFLLKVKLFLLVNHKVNLSANLTLSVNLLAMFHSHQMNKFLLDHKVNLFLLVNHKADSFLPDHMNLAIPMDDYQYFHLLYQSMSDQDSFFQTALSFPRASSDSDSYYPSYRPSYPDSLRHTVP